MIAVIIDIVSSRELAVQKRKTLDKKIRKLLREMHNRFMKNCLAVPSLTQGDSIELLVSNWLPIIFVVHNLLMENLELRIGFGTGNIIVQNENADECDGPVFWNARQALDEIKKRKYMISPAGFRFDKKTSSNEANVVTNSILFFTTLLGLSTTQRRYCFQYIWEKQRVSEIAKIVKSSKGNISRTLSKTPCYLLEEIVSFQNDFK